MSEIQKAYEPSEVEAKWYRTWLEKKCFSGKLIVGKEGYAIAIPPPNVTGVLTMGHVLNNTVQDVLARRARQKGKSVVWIPGTDHAGLATQTRVEKGLLQQGITRQQLGREKFLEKTREWRDKHGGIIIEQLKRLGCSCDWGRLVHTLDEDYYLGVIEAFVKLYHEGMIYRGMRMVNWCPGSKTALSDEELVPKQQKSSLYHVKYELVDRPGEYLVVATVRPETIMADAAIAVHPEDERYKHLIGQRVWRPLNRKQIPVIGDTAVLKEFGTGVLKVTPGHDKTDFEIGQRHHLPVIDIIDTNGYLTTEAGEPFVGVERFKARKLAGKILEESGLLVKEEPYDNTVFYSERADVPIEPKVSEQWFMKYPRVQEAKEVVRQGIIRFHPQRWEKTYLHWLENIQDWCISRQVWWGHRIPVWYPKGKPRSNPQDWHVSVEGPKDPENWEQDEDTLDTWASSWIWPFAILGWKSTDPKLMTPIAKEELAYWYPTHDLVTGPDIIFFWVARMIMAGLEFMEGSLEERIPFKNVYFTGIIRDALGRKMSKSLGNSPDPIELIEKYGADGLRFGILHIAPQGQDIHFSEERIELGRNLCNKLWNAARFRQMMGTGQACDNLEAIIHRIDGSKMDADDDTILLRLVQTIDSVDQALTEYQFSQAVQELQRFFWSDYCDWYVEVSKAKLQDVSKKSHCIAIHDLCLRQILLLLHPFMPFITEELWECLGFRSKDQGTFLQDVFIGSGNDLLKQVGQHNILPKNESINEIEGLRELVNEARSLKVQYQLQSKMDVVMMMKANNEGWSMIENNRDKLKKMIGFSTLERVTQEPEGAPGKVTRLGTIYLELKGAIDVEAERKKLSKELEKSNKAIAAGESKLNNEAFVSKAPTHILEGAKTQLDEARKKKEEIQRLLAVL